MAVNFTDRSVGQGTLDQGKGPCVAIVGGGITGLSAAHRLRELHPRLQVMVLEAGARPGGVLHTVREDGFLIESSADSFLTTVPWVMALCRRVGLEDQLLPTDPTRRRAFVVHQGRLARIPDGLMLMAPGRLWPVLTSPILSLRGKLRFAGELLVRPGPGDDESLAAFAVRRFGREAYERLIQPLVGGIYTADPERLSLKATMPRFWEMEQTHGSLIRAAWLQPSRLGKSRPSGSGARYGMFAAPRGGMSDLVEALVRRLPPGTVRCHTPVEQLRRGPDGRWSLRIHGHRRAWLDADAVILTTPAPETSRLLADIDPELSERLSRIATAGCAIVALGYRRRQIAHPLDGFGFVVPKIERRSILSGSFSSVKFAGRSPHGSVLVRVFLGGACSPELLARSDEGLIALAERELAPLLRIGGEPVLRHLKRWPQVMPQYQVGHGELVASIAARVASLPGLELAGNAYQGVGVPHCIHSGEQAAERIAADLAAVPSHPSERPSLETIGS